MVTPPPPPSELGAASHGWSDFWECSGSAQGRWLDASLNFASPAAPSMGRGGVERLRLRPREGASPAQLGWDPPSRQGARWAPLVSGACRHLPLSFRGCSCHGGSGTCHPPPSSGGPAPPAAGSGRGDRQGPGRGAVGAEGAGMAGERGGLRRGALGLGSAEPDRRPSRTPRLGARSHEDGEKSGAGDHREVLHAPRQ